MYFRASSAPMAAAEADSPSLVEGAMSRGRPLRRWALAAMVTLESVTPAALAQGVSPCRGRDEQVQQLLGADGLGGLYRGDDPVVADALHLRHQVVALPKGCRGGRVKL